MCDRIWWYGIWNAIWYTVRLWNRRWKMLNGFESIKWKTPSKCGPVHSNDTLKSPPKNYIILNRNVSFLESKLWTLVKHIKQPSSLLRIKRNADVIFLCNKKISTLKSNHIWYICTAFLLNDQFLPNIKF